MSSGVAQLGVIDVVVGGAASVVEVLSADESEVDVCDSVVGAGSMVVVSGALCGCVEDWSGCELSGTDWLLVVVLGCSVVGGGGGGVVVSQLGGTVVGSVVLGGAVGQVGSVGGWVVGGWVVVGWVVVGWVVGSVVEGVVVLLSGTIVVVVLEVGVVVSGTVGSAGSAADGCSPAGTSIGIGDDGSGVTPEAYAAAQLSTFAT